MKFHQLFQHISANIYTVILLLLHKACVCELWKLVITLK